MNKFFRLSFLAAALFSAVVLVSCKDEDPPLPDNTVQFQSSTQGLGATQTELVATITFVRAVETAGSLTLSFVPTGLIYGDDFITDPVIDAGNKIVVPVAVGATEASFKITKTNTTGLQGDEKVVFTIDAAPSELVIGTQKTFTLSFTEIIATSASMEIAGGGVNANNRVFIDLSANRQVAVGRQTWDLAFSSEAGKFRVFLNSSNKMLARALDKKDLTEVHASDTTGWGAQTDLASIFATLFGESVPEWAYQSTGWIDSPKNLTTTAIAEIDADDDKNLVYIVNRGQGSDNAHLGWKKIRVIRKGDNYTLQYANISDTEFTSIDIPKNSDTNLTYFTFNTNNVVTVEPKSAEWDIAWTGLTNTLPVGGPGQVIAYYYQDMIIQNPNVSTAQILTSAVSYNDYAEANIANTTFVSDNLINIGSSWRDTQSGPVLKEDRFYVIKDEDGNVYKLKFTALVVNGERGKPTLQFDLVKKGS